MRIATYNVHGCVGTDDRFDVARTGDAVAALEADVVLLQEVGDWRKRRPPLNQAEALAGACRMQFAVGYTIASAPWGYGNVVLTSYAIGATDRFDLSVARKEPRGCLRVGVEVANGALTVVGVHLGLSRRERFEQIARLLDGGACDPRAALVVGGDFNDFPPGPTAELTRRGFVDAARARRDRRGTFPSRMPLFRLDRLYSRGGISLRRYDVVTSRLHRVASDHLPVVAEYELSDR